MEDVKTFKLYDSTTQKIYEVRAKPAGHKVWKAKCCFPPHEDTDPSLTIYEEDGHYHCFGCDKHGKLWDDKWMGQKIDSIGNLFKQAVASNITQSLAMQEAVIRANELISMNIPEPKFILKPWIAEETISMVVGWRGTGKTWFSLGIASSITMGYPKFGPWEVVSPSPVLYVDGEMSLYSLQQRLKMLGHNQKKEKAPLFIYSNALANAKEKPSTNLYILEHREGIRDICKKEGIKVLFLDNIASLAPGEDENARKGWDPINQWLLSLRFTGVSTVMLDHEGKGRVGPRGTSGKEDNIDYSIVLAHPHDYMVDDGIRFRVNFTKNRADYTNIHLIAEIEFKGTKINDRLYLTHEPVAPRNELKILDMVSQGKKQVNIAKELGISKQYVSKVVNQSQPKVNQKVNQI